MSEYDSSLRTGLIAINLKPDDELVRVIQTSGDDDIFMVSRERHDASASPRPTSARWAGPPPACGA